MRSERIHSVVPYDEYQANEGHSEEHEQPNKQKRMPYKAWRQI